MIGYKYAISRRNELGTWHPHGEGVCVATSIKPGWIKLRVRRSMVNDNGREIFGHGEWFPVASRCLKLWPQGPATSDAKMAVAL